MEPASRYLDQKDWVQTTTGAGTVVSGDGGKSVVCQAVAGDRATLQYFLVGWPGDSFEFSVVAKNVDTGKAGLAEIFIDSPIGQRREEEDITAPDPENITIKYDIPVAANTPRVVVFGLGVSTDTDGSAECMIPRIKRMNGNTFLRATLRADSAGGMFVHSTLPAFNVNDASITWDAANLEMVVVPRETTTFTNGPHTFKPTIIATGGPDNSGADPVIWNVGRVLTNGTFSVQALNADTGARLDLNAGTGSDLFVSIKMEL